VKNFFLTETDFGREIDGGTLNYVGKVYSGRRRNCGGLSGNPRD
jgi:hypothetical protein